MRYERLMGSRYLVGYRGIETTRKMVNNRLDVSVLDHASGCWAFIDFAVGQECSGQGGRVLFIVTWLKELGIPDVLRGMQ